MCEVDRVIVFLKRVCKRQRIVEWLLTTRRPAEILVGCALDAIDRHSVVLKVGYALSSLLPTLLLTRIAEHENAHALVV